MSKLFLFSMILTALSCSDHLPELGCDPGENDGWLDDKIELLKKSGTGAEVYLWTYKGKTVVEINACVNCSDAMTAVYDGAGNEICLFGGIAGLNTCPDFATEATDRRLYWKQ
jgi:hypothetical protein